MKGNEAKRERETNPGLTPECFCFKNGAVAVWEAVALDVDREQPKLLRVDSNRGVIPFAQQQSEVRV